MTIIKGKWSPARTGLLKNGWVPSVTDMHEKFRGSLCARGWDCVSGIPVLVTRCIVELFGDNYNYESLFRNKSSQFASTTTSY